MCACPVDHLNYEGATDKTCHDDDAPGRLAALFDKQCHQRCRAGNGAATATNTKPTPPRAGRAAVASTWSLAARAAGKLNAPTVTTATSTYVAITIPTER